MEISKRDCFLYFLLASSRLLRNLTRAVAHISRAHTYLEWNSDLTLTATASISSCLESLPTLTLPNCKGSRASSSSFFTVGGLWSMGGGTWGRQGG